MLCNVWQKKTRISYNGRLGLKLKTGLLMVDILKLFQ